VRVRQTPISTPLNPPEPHTAYFADKTHKLIDALLAVLTLVLMIFAFRASAQHRQNSAEPTRAAQAETAAHK
jgi:hypothetical protein